MNSKQWDVVVVAFPFSNQPGAKRRPALVLSDPKFNSRGHTVLAMITTSAHRSWPSDVSLADHKVAGLHTQCLVRLKIFTLDNRLVLKCIGHLSAGDRKQIETQLQTYLHW